MAAKAELRVAAAPVGNPIARYRRLTAGRIALHGSPCRSSIPAPGLSLMVSGDAQVVEPCPPDTVSPRRILTVRNPERRRAEKPPAARPSAVRPAHRAAHRPTR